MKKLYMVRDKETNSFVMLAEMDTIERVFKLHVEAVHRVKMETTKGYGFVSCVHFNGRGTNGICGDAITIKEVNPFVDILGAM